MKREQRSWRKSYQCPACGAADVVRFHASPPADKFQRCTDTDCHAVFVVMWDAMGVGTNFLSFDYDGDLSILAMQRRLCDVTFP
jgi:hypothetical protein